MGTAPDGVGANGSAGAGAGRATAGRRDVLMERARVFIKGHRVLMAPLEWLDRSVDGLPGPLNSLATRVRGSVIRQTTLEDLLALVTCLEAHGIAYWLAGGWGVDALTGHQTRPHKDIDMVIDDFECNEPKVREAIRELGYHHVNMDQGGVWMPRRSNFENAAGHRVECVNIDWDHLRAVFTFDAARPPGASTSEEDLAAEMLTEGTIDGRRMPCLTAAAQLLFHSGFYLEPSGYANLALLNAQANQASPETG